MTARTAKAPRLVEQVTTPSAREAAIEERDGHEATARQWLADKAASETKLAETLERAGDLILDDPAAIDDLSTDISRARARIDMADRTVGKASDRYLVAARAVLVAEAAELDAPLSEARAALQACDDRTAELLAALVEHTGVPWQEVPLRDRTDKVAIGTGFSVPASSRAHLYSRVAELEEQQASLLTRAERVAPLQLTDVNLARASLRLLEVDGAVSESSLANVRACAQVLLDQAETLEGEKSDAIGTLWSAFRSQWPAIMSHGGRSASQEFSTPSDAPVSWMVDDWAVTDEALLAAQKAVQSIRQRQASLRADAELLRAALAPRAVAA